ncbi:MAG: proteasome subunit alpha [Nitrospirae bacterium]|nr:proteasome subunit alpha [Candidatus Manganitrophaceae bacterium]
MFEEPYRWAEAVSNRREYLEDQLQSGSPVVALPCIEGILLLSVSAGTQKVYEIYDRVALGALGHPADVERLRNIVIDMAHLEGFNRSPSDVSARRLVQFGLAPPVKQAFEEIGRAPYIARLLIAELGKDQSRIFYSLNYDGVFKETHTGLVLATPGEATERCESALKNCEGLENRAMSEVFGEAFKLWGLAEVAEDSRESHLRDVLKDREIEAMLLSESVPGPCKVRPLSKTEMMTFSQPWRAPA